MHVCPTKARWADKRMGRGDSGCVSAVKFVTDEVALAPAAKSARAVVLTSSETQYSANAAYATPSLSYQ